MGNNNKLVKINKSNYWVVSTMFREENYIVFKRQFLADMDQRLMLLGKLNLFYKKIFRKSNILI